MMLIRLGSFYYGLHNEWIQGLRTDLLSTTLVTINIMKFLGYLKFSWPSIETIYGPAYTYSPKTTWNGTLFVKKTFKKISAKLSTWGILDYCRFGLKTKSWSPPPPPSGHREFGTLSDLDSTSKLKHGQVTPLRTQGKVGTGPSWAPSGGASFIVFLVKKARRYHYNNYKCKI